MPAGESHRAASELVLDGPQQVEQQQPAAAQALERRERQAEAAHQRIGEADDGLAVRGAPGRVALEERGIARIAAAGVREQLREHRDVAEREIESLSRDGMERLRGVAENHGPRRRQSLRAREGERIGLPAADAREPPEAQAERPLQFRDEVPVLERKRAARVVGRERPDDGRAALRDRQHGDRSRRREALVGRVLVKARRIDVGDDCVLAVVGNARLDAERLAHADCAPSAATTSRAANDSPASVRSSTESSPDCRSRTPDGQRCSLGIALTRSRNARPSRRFSIV